MIVDRRTFVVKRGCMEEAAAMLQGGVDELPEDTSGTVLIPDVAPFDVLCIEVRFTDWDAYHRLWAEYAPGDEWWAKWFELTESGGTHEVWRVFE